MSDRSLSLQEHLGELRRRLVISVVALLAGFVAAWLFRIPLFNLLSGPVREGLANNGLYSLTAIELPETIFVYVKLSLVAGLVMASPVVFYQLWRFVSPGLHRHEQAMVLPLTIFSVLFFALGVTFCHRVLLPFVADFLTGMTLAHPDITMQVTVRNAFSFSLRLLLAFGVAFELPLVLFFLTAIGLTTPRGLLRFFRYFMVLSFFVGAFFTPPDPVSQAMMAVPLNGLYLLGVGMSAMVARQRARGHSGMLSLRAWVVIGTMLTLVAGGLGYVAHTHGGTTSILGQVPANARLVLGLRLADHRARDAFAMVAESWPDRKTARGVGTVLDNHDCDVVEAVMYQTRDRRDLLLLRGRLGDDCAAALREALGEAPLALASDLSVLGASDLAAAGIEMVQKGLAIEDIGHRREVVHGVRRSGPVWFVAWDDPVVTLDPAAMVLGQWDSPLIEGFFSPRDDAPFGLSARLRAAGWREAADKARRLSTWRERRRGDAMLDATERARRDCERYTLERLERLAGAVGQAARDGALETAPEERSAVIKELEALRAEFAAELEAHAGATPGDEPQGLKVDDVLGIDAVATGAFVQVQAVFTAEGAADLMALAAERLAESLPDHIE